LKYCISLLQNNAGAKKQQLKLLGAPVIIPGDREKLWRVFSNLITNAIKFSAESSEITVVVKQTGSSAVVEVQDNGIGIPDTIKSRLFEASTEVKRKGTAGEESFGLGLMICKQIVDQHRGRIWFTSQQGKGTTFYVEFPLTFS
jgi:signal transduction histidine kinase